MPERKSEKVVHIPVVQLKEGEITGDVSTQGADGKSSQNDCDITVKFIITTLYFG